MRYCYCIFVLCFNLKIYSQDLLANGSFEEENICTEYNKNCAPEGWIGNAFLINYYFDTEGWARDGSHFIGLIAGNKELKSKRSFIRSRLLCGLRKGHQYKLEFYLRSRHSVLDSLGIYFSSTDFLYEKKPYTQLKPSLVFRDTLAAFALENRQWRKISFYYTATGEENFITIGSFKKLEYRYSLPPEYKGNYYLYLDAISMRPVDKHELLCKDADRMRSVIYAENERHSLLEKRVTFYMRKVPVEITPHLTLLQQIDTLVIPDILFATASAKLNEASFKVLDSFCVALSSKNIDSIIIDGHTDSIGTLAYNNKLSADRAGSVSTYIKNKLSLNQRFYFVHHYAYLRPIASNTNAAGRQRNRRVEIYLYSYE